VDDAVGRLVPSRDPGALADAIGSLAGQPEIRASLGEKARARVLGRFTVEAMVDRYFDLYQGAQT
jgi:glycosyltransferase involved in cell wall biosynthesis